MRETETIRESTKTGWIDFEIWNENVLAGVIEDIQIFPGQVMAMMRRKGQLVMIPLADALINEVSEAQKGYICRYLKEFYKENPILTYILHFDEL